MFGAMWSEHCAYKHSRPLLAGLPSDRRRGCWSARARTRARWTSATGWPWCSRSNRTTIPARSSPTRVPPPGWAASSATSSPWAPGPSPCSTPCASGHWIRRTIRPAGPMSGGNPQPAPVRRGGGRHRRLRQLHRHTRCGGEIAFDPGFSGNPLVNAMCVGVARHDEITLARAAGVGNALMLVGAATGRDGIQGASFASAGLDEDSEERRPAVQVGNPFLEKLLMEACLELSRLRGGGRHAGPGRRRPDLRAGRAVGARRLRRGGDARPGAGPRGGDDAVRAAAVRVAGADAARGRAGHEEEVQRSSPGTSCTRCRSGA